MKKEEIGSYPAVAGLLSDLCIYANGQECSFFKKGAELLTLGIKTTYGCCYCFSAITHLKPKCISLEGRCIVKKIDEEWNKRQKDFANEVFKKLASHNFSEDKFSEFKIRSEIELENLKTNTNEKKLLDIEDIFNDIQNRLKK